MPTEEEKRAYINDLVKTRGYAHRSHRLMANHDLDFLKAMRPVPHETYIVERWLTFAEKELLLVPAFACLRSPAYIIKVHIIKAVSAGMPLRWVLEAIELLAFEAGRTIFTNALLAFQDAAEGQAVESTGATMSKPDTDITDAYRPPYEMVLEKYDATILEAVQSLNRVVHDEQRVLSPRLKELLTVVILTTLKAPEDSIKHHIRAAIAAGATQEEVLEAIELIVTPAGLPIFEHGLMAWADVTNAKGVDPDQEGYANQKAKPL
jgi:4-carboxymuconolactone decarboxylase